MRRPPPKGRLPAARAAVAAVLLAALATPAAADDAAHSRADCDADAAASVLHPSDERDARAHWLDRRLATWPGVAAEGRFRLYHSRLGRIAARAGEAVAGADGSLVMVVMTGEWPEALARRFPLQGQGVTLAVDEAGAAQLRELHRGQLVLAHEDDDGRVREATALQPAGALDDLFASAEDVADLGATVASATGRKATRFLLWAPTAQRVSVCLYEKGSGPALSVRPLRREATTGVWTVTAADDLSGRYYAFLVDVFARGTGVVRSRVTDPYSLALSADSRRSLVADLDAASLKPPGWGLAPAREAAVDAEQPATPVGVRPFPLGDACPRHFTVDEATEGTAADGASRILGMRALVAAVQGAGLRVLLETAYHRVAAAGPGAPPGLDRIVPGYYHRLDERGAAAGASACAATALAHRMMAKLMRDSLATWARAYRIDAFRLDGAGAYPRELLERIAAQLKAETGRDVALATAEAPLP